MEKERNMGGVRGKILELKKKKNSQTGIKCSERYLIKLYLKSNFLVVYSIILDSSRLQLSFTLVTYMSFKTDRSRALVAHACNS
jgi:hypothetical protein